MASTLNDFPLRWRIPTKMTDVVIPLFARNVSGPSTNCISEDAEESVVSVTVPPLSVKRLTSRKCDATEMRFSGHQGFANLHPFVVQLRTNDVLKSERVDLHLLLRSKDV